jgi:hypothetical protein
MTWYVRPESSATPDATWLRRDYYSEVASRWWKRPATEEEIDQGWPDRRTTD